MLFGIIIGFPLLSILWYVILCMFYVIPDLFTVFVVVILLHSFLPRVERSRLFQRREACHGTFGDRSPYLEQAYQYANPDNNYVDLRWRRKDRIDEYYLIGINECHGEGYTFKIIFFHSWQYSQIMNRIPHKYHWDPRPTTRSLGLDQSLSS